MLFCFTIQSYDFFEKRTNKNQIIFIKSRKNIEKSMKKTKHITIKEKAYD